eukprot:5815082-Prymnesium_polylepis.1
MSAATAPERKMSAFAALARKVSVKSTTPPEIARRQSITPRKPPKPTFTEADLVEPMSEMELQLTRPPAGD